MRTLRFLLLLAGTALGVVGEWALYGWGDPGRWVPDLAAGWSMLGCGLVAWSRWPQSRAGVLMTATGLSWFAGNFVTADTPWLAWLSAHALFWYRGPLVELVLSYPGARRARLVNRAAIGGGYVAAVVAPIWQSDAAAIALSGCLVAVASASYLRAVGRERRERLAAWQATTFLGLVIAGGAAGDMISASQGMRDARVLAQAIGLCALALALLAGLIARPWERAPFVDLVVELGEARSGTLRTALARTLGDPTLEVGFWSPDAAGYLDERGRPLELPRPGADRSVTRIEREGQTVAAVVHDPAVLDDPALVSALAAASRLEASHARLQAEVRAQLAELESSRRRLVRTGTMERRRLERRLHDGAERRLLFLEQLLELARAHPGTRPELLETLGRAEAQLGATLAELTELARGLHPPALTEGGLAETLVALAEQSAVPVDLSVASERLPEEVEAAVYFLCSEALANVAKYASASSVAVSVAISDAVVEVEIEDDGVGGADPARGSGLRGLADRLDALGGTLMIESVPGKGTLLIGKAPLG
ncbi:MAG TPA: histidine kinase [Gaiellaceae bacterium]